MTRKLFMMPVLILVTGFIAMGFMKPEKNSVKPLPSELLTVLETYKKAAIEQDAKTLVSVANPAFYKLASKQELIKILQDSYENKQAPTIKNITFTTHGAETNYSVGAFQTVNYFMEMTLPRPGDATPQIDQMMIKMIAKTFGKETKVEIDEKNSLVVISYASWLVALHEKEQDWSILDVDQFEMLSEAKHLPEDLVKLIKTERYGEEDVQAKDAVNSEQK